MSLLKAFKLYAQFLYEFPTHPEEDDLELQIFVPDDSMLLYLVRLNNESVITNKYASVFNRVNYWFASRSLLSLERADKNRSRRVFDRLEELSLREHTAWAFSVLAPVAEPNGQVRYKYV